MITRTTLKALWVGGGGILATWIAVSPDAGVPAASQAGAVQQPVAIEQPSAEQLNTQADRLRDRAADIALRRPSTRNPFRFNAKKPRDVASPSQHGGAPPASETAPPAPPSARPLILSGMAEKAGKRTAVITIDGQIYLVSEGETFADQYTVVQVDPETALIRDAAGVEQRLVLP